MQDDRSHNQGQQSAAKRDTTDPADRHTVTSPATASPHVDVQAGQSSLQTHRVRRADGAVHLVFGSLEEFLGELTDGGAPDGNIVRVERLVRSRSHTLGGTATHGIAVTARRGDEILSAWVVVGRLELDPWGQPLSPTAAHPSAVRHHDAQRVLAAYVADAGFEVRDGLYLLSEGCFGFNATAALLAAGSEREPERADPAAFPTEQTGDTKHA